MEEDLAACVQYFIAIEQKLLLESTSLITALFNLVASHYVFNLAYHPRAHDLLAFLQEKVMGIAGDGRRKKPSSSSHVSGIARFYQTGSAAK